MSAREKLAKNQRLNFSSPTGVTLCPSHISKPRSDRKNTSRPTLHTEPAAMQPTSAEIWSNCQMISSPPSTPT
jgi:hypothetical protein